MASLQCYQPVDQYNQGQYHAPAVVDTQTQCTTKTNAYYSDSGLAKTQTAQCYGQSQTTNPNHNLGYGSYNSHSHSHSHTPGYGYATGSTHGPGLGPGGLGHGLTPTHGSTHGHGHGHGLNHSHSSTHGHGHGHGLNHTHGSGLGHSNSSNGVTASGRHCGRRGEHKRRGLFQKLRDGFSSDTSCSSSDSESDDEHCGNGTRVSRRPYC